MTRTPDEQRLRRTFDLGRALLFAIVLLSVAMGIWAVATISN